MNDADSSAVNRLGTTSTSSGLTLVLPSLKALKELNAKKKSSPLLEPTPVKKNARPVKLKPLKEVLTSLITKIKKKDDYAFFLRPVDTEKVSGYLEVITQPMDFGTMTEKVARSKYRSLDEFAEDFRLVISNAKTFNPPGTIYRTEAERIEAWASDHISKASSCVIEYETEWNIDADRDEDVNVDADEDAGGPGRTGSIGPDTPARRSPSVLSASVPPTNRRGGRNAASKKEGPLSESLESDGHLPGFKDGVGVFPAGSDWAEVMLALKLKGKRYRSKKERLRMEKGGPPYAADGSLDYAEMEDPFSVLSALVPDLPCAAPLVTPLFPPPPPSQQDSSLQITLPLPINVPAPTEIPTTPAPATTPAAPVSQPTPTEGNKSKYRHWTITRPTPPRGRAKDPAVEERPPTPEWRKPRPLHTADYGLFPSLAITGPSSPGGKPEALATQERLFEALYASLENPTVAVGSSEVFSSCSSATINKRPTATATVAQNWLREVVYGGWDGLAYTRSVAEFVAPHPSPSPSPSPNPDEKVEENFSDRGSLNANAALVEYVDAVLVNELTEGRHRTMEAALAGEGAVPDEQQNLLPTPVVPPPTQLDLGSLISAPNELFDAENAWVGAGANEDSAVLGRALDHATHLLERLQLQQARRAASGCTGDAQGAEGMDVDVDVDVESKDVPLEGEKKPEEGRGDLETELRMNLIALAKRAPLDQIARMPSELVPPHLRHVVPTIGY